MKSYVVRVSSFGHVTNRAEVDKGAQEGRVIPPIAVYVPQGEQVSLDPSHDATKRAIELGSIEEPGASEERERAALESRLAQVKAEQDQLAQRAKQLKS
jgi:hypothetical protein